MSSNINSAGQDGILDILSFAGVPFILIDRNGNIIRKSGSIDGTNASRLEQVFDGLPGFPLSPSGEILELTLKSTGTSVQTRILQADRANGYLAVLIESNHENRIETGHGSLVYAANDLVFHFNEEGKVYFVSGNVDRITGYTQEDFLSGRIHPLDIVHPEDRSALEKEFNEIFKTHRSAENSEHRILRKSGDTAYVLKSWYVLRDSAGRFNGVVGVNKDITEERMLKERLRLFHSAFEHSTDAIVITGTDGRIVDVNDAFTAIYGYPRDEVIGKSTSVLQSGHSTREFYSQMWESLNAEGQWHGEIINRTKDGKEIPIWLSITPISLDDRKIGYMGIESDISDRKNLEQQIIQTEKLATIGQLAAGIAHEIGTPLNIISGNAEFILLDMKDTDPGYRELVTIIEQTKRMSQLMRQLLDFARPKVLSLQPTDINGVIRDVLNFIKVQFKRGEIEISREMEEQIPPVYGDPALLYQVFLNIVVNAYQAMPNGGSLRIHTDEETGVDGHDKVVIEISDTGEGILPENMKKIFTPFFTTKEPGKGTGLGLAVTKRIVQEHNGTIDLSSEPGKGTVFTIRFNAFGAARPRTKV